MVSKRNFFSITIMMFVLLFLFQFSMVIRDRQNTYDVNSNFTTRQKDGKNVWKNKQIDPVAVRTTDRSYALFVGDSSSDMATAVSRWCIYAKWDMAQCRNLEDYQENDKALPGMLILESEKYALGDNLEKLEKLEQKGVIIVFGCLENPKNIEKNQELMDFLGIYKVVSEKTKLTGVKLFEGLLLGGEVVYETPKEKEEKERQDLQLEIPWYQVGSGTKTYMVGLLDHSKQKTQVENEDLPTILWRNGIKGGSVFCIVGDYMKDSTALGLLNGMITEASEYYIYPVVNAQNLSMINFPAFADENDEEMMKLYSQSVTGMTRDIMWPSLVSKQEKYIIPTEYLFFYVEKKPIQYAQYHFFTGPRWLAQAKYTKFYKYSNAVLSEGDEIANSQISEFLLNDPITITGKASDAYSNIKNREILESEMYFWCQKFKMHFPNEIKVYYEDEDFICYVVKQNTDHLYDLSD